MSERHSHLPVTNTLDGERLVGWKQIADFLGINPNQVYMWHERRGRNGFPEAVALNPGSNGGGGRRRAPLFRFQEVLDWWVEYDPSVNRGAPKGNRYALKHGRYVGRRARRALHRQNQDQESGAA